MLRNVLRDPLKTHYLLEQLVAQLSRFQIFMSSISFNAFKSEGMFLSLILIIAIHQNYI